MNKILISMLAMLLLASCGWKYKYVDGDGNIVTRPFNESGFEAIKASGIVYVKIVQGQQYSVTCTTDDNLMKYVKVRRDGNRLWLGTENNVNLDPTDKIEFTVTTPSLMLLELSGVTKAMTVGDEFEPGPALKVSMSGSSDAKLKLRATALSLDMSGAAELLLMGTARKTEMDASGASHIKGGGFQSFDAHIEAQGASNVIMAASNFVDVDASGASNVDVAGVATSRVRAEASGASNVKVRSNESVDAHASGSAGVIVSGTGAALNARTSGAGYVRRDE